MQCGCYFLTRWCNNMHQYKLWIFNWNLCYGMWLLYVLKILASIWSDIIGWEVPMKFVNPFFVSIPITLNRKNIRIHFKWQKWFHLVVWKLIFWDMYSVTYHNCVFQGRGVSSFSLFQSRIGVAFTNWIP